MKYFPRKTPCRSCPYRRDVPSGIWSSAEYEILPGYDGDITSQAASGALRLFMCHEAEDYLCAGWAGCHGLRDTLAARLHADNISHSAWDYNCPVPLFASGAEACAHGLRDISDPSPEAKDAVQRIIARWNRP